MNHLDIPSLRLTNQQLAQTKLSTPKEIVSWMGAMQAQDFPMAEWAVGLRLPDSTINLIENAINKGEILRTHLLRPTWHFVTPEDIYWLVELSAPQIISGQASRDRDLELTKAIYKRSNQIIEKALSSAGQLRREDLIVVLNQAGIATNENRSAHLLMRAELEKIICSGAILRGKPSYALLAQRASVPKRVSKEEALSTLAQRYFTSRGPATMQDFTWWSGLRANDVKQAIELARPELATEKEHGVEYFMAKNVTSSQTVEPSVLLLPTYDEFIIGYENRRDSIPPDLEQHMKQISNRGVFWPILVIDGKVKGIWNRMIKKDLLTVEIKPFSPIKATLIPQIEEAATQLASFLGKKLVFLLSSQEI